jgi:hypothetical protein
MRLEEDLDNVWKMRMATSCGCGCRCENGQDSRVCVRLTTALPAAGTLPDSRLHSASTKASGVSPQAQRASSPTKVDSPHAPPLASGLRPSRRLLVLNHPLSTGACRLPNDAASWIHGASRARAYDNHGAYTNIRRQSYDSRRQQITPVWVMPCYMTKAARRRDTVPICSCTPRAAQSVLARNPPRRLTSPRRPRSEAPIFVA